MGKEGEHRVNFWAWMATVIKAFQYEQQEYVETYEEAKRAPEVHILLDFFLLRETPTSDRSRFERSVRTWRYVVPDRGDTLGSEPVSELLQHYLIMAPQEGESECTLTLTVELHQLDTSGNAVMQHPLFQELERCERGEWESVGNHNGIGKYVITYNKVPCEG